MTSFEFCKTYNKLYKNIKFFADKNDVFDSVTIEIKCKEPIIVAQRIESEFYGKIKSFNIGVIKNKAFFTFYDFSERNQSEIENYILEILNDLDFKYNIMKESKKGVKTMRKSLKERFNAPRDWDFDEMVVNYGMEYLDEIGRDWEDTLHDMEDMEYYLQKEDVTWLLQRCYYGGVWERGNYTSKESFNPNESYYVVNAYGNFFSISDYYIEDWKKEKIEELDNGEESFYEWCVDNGYFESEEDE